VGHGTAASPGGARHCGVARWGTALWRRQVGHGTAYSRTQAEITEIFTQIYSKLEN